MDKPIKFFYIQMFSRERKWQNISMAIAIILCIYSITGLIFENSKLLYMYKFPTPTDIGYYYSNLYKHICILLLSIIGVIGVHLNNYFLSLFVRFQNYIVFCIFRLY
jgi:hypothetical protein